MLKNGPQTIVKCVGAMTINNAQEIKSKFFEALSLSQKVLLDAEKVDDLDLTFLQLICSAHRTALFENKTFAIEKKAELFTRFAEEAGFRRNSGCIKNPSCRCLWEQEGSNE